MLVKWRITVTTTVKVLLQHQVCSGLWFLCTKSTKGLKHWKLTSWVFQCADPKSQGGKKPAVLLLNPASNLAVAFMFSLKVSEYLHIKNYTNLSVTGITFSVISDWCFSDNITRGPVGVLTAEIFKTQKDWLPSEMQLQPFSLKTAGALSWG